ncbi:MAG TPA: SCO family protein [Anaeromyxobacter sp.]|nr:SCO family protein [Anaeromyxobacter sp.]
MHGLRRSLLPILAAAIAAWPPAPARADDAHDEQCGHHAGSAPERYTRSTQRSALPAVTLLDQDGRAVPLDRALAGDAPLAVNFIFTTCTTICPVMSATFADLRRRLAADGRGVRLVSISIDPAHDRPGRLKEYGRRFGADERWSFYTGSEADVAQVLTALRALEGDKTNHRPVTLLRRAGGEEWVRIEGLAGAEDLARELRALLAGR